MSPAKIAALGAFVLGCMACQAQGAGLSDTASADNSPRRALTGAAPASPSSRQAPRPRTERDYIGKWIGVEGLLLEVARGTHGKLVVFNVWSLEPADQGAFDATVVPEGLRWTRRGETVVARPGNGAATGLRWLDGRKNCLTVVEGEGYCRD